MPSFTFLQCTNEFILLIKLYVVLYSKYYSTLYVVLYSKYYSTLTFSTINHLSCSIEFILNRSCYKEPWRAVDGCKFAMSRKFNQLLTVEKVEAKVAFTAKSALKIELFYVILEGYSHTTCNATILMELVTINCCKIQRNYWAILGLL